MKVLGSIPGGEASEMKKRRKERTIDPSKDGLALKKKNEDEEVASPENGRNDRLWPCPGYWTPKGAREKKKTRSPGLSFSMSRSALMGTSTAHRTMSILQCIRGW